MTSTTKVSKFAAERAGSVLNHTASESLRQINHCVIEPLHFHHLSVLSTYHRCHTTNVGRYNNDSQTAAGDGGVYR